MRVRTSLPRSIRPRETPTSAHLGDAKERPCSRHRHGRRGGPAHLAEGRRGAPFRPRSPQSFSEDPAPHWVHVQTSTSIDSSVSTLCLRTRVTTGPQSRSAGLALTDTLLPPRTAGVRERLPPRRSRACGRDLPSGGGRVGPRDRRVAAGAAGRADPKLLGVPSPGQHDRELLQAQPQTRRPVLSSRRSATGHPGRPVATTDGRCRAIAEG